MAVTLKRIESEFILATLKNEGTKIVLDLERTPLELSIKETKPDIIKLHASSHPHGIKIGMMVSFTFNFHGQKMGFGAKILNFDADSVSIETPESILRDLTRRFERIPFPDDIACKLHREEERYILEFPKIDNFDSLEDIEINDQFDALSVKDLIKSFESSTKGFSQERSITLFKDRKPESFDERIIAETGKALYLPSTSGGFPVHDPFPRPLALTQSMIASWFALHGVAEGFEKEEMERIVRNKKNIGILSELFHPVIFHEYVIGYVMLRNSSPGRPPFDYKVLQFVHDFCRSFAWALKQSGFFKGHETKRPEARSLILDISPQGILFSIPDQNKLDTFPLNSVFTIILELMNRTIEIKCKTLRKFQDTGATSIGAAFLDLSHNDFAFLHKYLYDKGISDEEIDICLQSTLF